jgi:peptidoglycan/LPS O-acetylase OafA/YrhL
VSRAERRRRDRAGAPPAPAAPTRFYGALDGWRGVCACLVALYHFRAPGAMGVFTRSHVSGNALIESAYLFTDFFFVLSGFVMAANYRDRLARDGGVGRFLALRLARVWPLHLFTLALVALVLLAASSAAATRLGHPVPAFTGVTSGPTFVLSALLLHAWHVVPYTVWNRPSWSISAEVTVYVLFALAMRWPAALRRAAVAVVLIGAPALIYFTKGQMDVTFDWGVPRAAFGFVLGALVYAGTERWPLASWLREGTAATITEGAAVLASGLFVAFSGGKALSILSPVLFAVVVFVFSFERGVVSALMTRAPMRQLGLWSYSIYLLHYPLQLFVAQFSGLWSPAATASWVTHATVDGRDVRTLGASAWQGDLLAVLMLAVVIGLAALTYRLIEQPPRRWMRQRLAGR